MIGSDRSRIWPALVLVASAMALTAIVILAAGAGTRPAAAGPNPTPPKIVGDVNDDGDVDSVDAALILQVVAGIITEGFLANAPSGDVNGDGDLNAIDAQIILQYEAGLLCCLPYPPPPTSTPTAPLPGTATSTIVLLATATPGPPTPTAPLPGTATSTVVLLATSTPVGTPSGSGSLDLGDALENVGGEVDLDLIGLDFPFPGLGAWTIDIMYDPQVVSGELCSGGISVCNASFASGVVRVAGASAAGLVGDSVLASVTLQCEVAGKSPLTIEPQLLVDGAVGVPQDILALTETSGGSITCLAAPSVLGGVAEYPELVPSSAEDVASRGGESLSAFEIALIVASVPVTALAWYARRRLVRR